MWKNLNMLLVLPENYRNLLLDFMTVTWISIELTFKSLKSLKSFYKFYFVVQISFWWWKLAFVEKHKLVFIKRSQEINNNPFISLWQNNDMFLILIIKQRNHSVTNLVNIKRFGCKCIVTHLLSFKYVVGDETKRRERKLSDL